MALKENQEYHIALFVATWKFRLERDFESERVNSSEVKSKQLSNFQMQMKFRLIYNLVFMKGS